MQEDDKTDIEDKSLSLHSVQDGQKDGREKPETFQETPIERSSSSKAPYERPPFVEWPEESLESSPQFFFIRNFSPLILSSWNRMFGVVV